MPVDQHVLERIDLECVDRALPTLRIDQITAMGRHAGRTTALDAARAAVIARVVPADALVARWREWVPVLGLPPVPGGVAPVAALIHPYAAVGHPHPVLAPYLFGVLAVLDAALAAADPEPGEETAALTAAWDAVVAPVGPDAEYGPRTAAVRAALAGPGAPVVPGPDLVAACRSVEDAAAAAGTPFLPRLLWGAAHRVAAAPVWGPAVAAAFGPALPVAAQDALAGAGDGVRTLAA
jgi:hypothetical protein